MLRFTSMSKAKVCVFFFAVLFPPQTKNAYSGIGLKFRFNGLTQTLELIEVLYGEKQSLKRKVTLWLKNDNLNKTKEGGLLTFEFISDLMGQATYPFSFINSGKHILLKYDGICFIFENLSGDPRVKQANINKCKLFKIAIFAEDTLEGSLKSLSIPFPIVDVTIGAGIDLVNSVQSTSKSIRFGDEMDYVLSILKNPQKVYPLPLNDTPGKGMHYRWNKALDVVLNYFTYGLDIVINGENHRVKKFILHTNMPSHPLFHFYDRCLFSILNPEALMIKRGPAAAAIPEEQKEKKAYTVHDRLFGPEFINTHSTWKHVKEILKEDEKDEDEVMYMRNWTKQLVKTVYYAREGAIFEVSESGHLCSVTLFDPMQ